MLRRVLITTAVVVLLPSILAAGLGVWTPLGGQQQHLALDLLLEILLWLEGFEPRTSRVEVGLIGRWEVPMLVGLALLLFGSTWDRKLPRLLQPLVDIPEMALISLGLVCAAAIVAVGASVDRLVFWAGAAVAVGVGLHVRGAPRPADDDGWRAPSNRLRRAALVASAAALAFYGVTSLWEGASYRNPVFRVADRWLEGPGASPWTAGGVWLVLCGVPGIVLMSLWIRGVSGTSRKRIYGGLGLCAAVAVASALTTPAGHLAVANGLSAAGLLLLAVGVGPWVTSRRLPKRPAVGVLDPRQVAAAMIPLILWGGLCLVRGFTVTMWTAPGDLPAGVERLADASCAFGLRVRGEDLYWTDRCRREIGHVSPTGSVDRWDLEALGVDHVEELGGPDVDGTLYAAVTSSTTPESRLVLLAIHPELGPRGLPGVEPTPADRAGTDLPAYMAVPNCWVSSWIPIADTDDVLLGCENRSGALRVRPERRQQVASLELTSRLESGTFAAGRLVGVSLWQDPRIVAWSWPDGEEVARRTLGAFNWTVTAVPDPAVLWVGRFIEGEVLLLDPTTLQTQDRVRLSFGVRAMEYDPVHDRVWAAAAYTGLLWSIEAHPPYRRRAFALCGEARDLAADSRGRVSVATDCGVFRVDPTGWD